MGLMVVRSRLSTAGIAAALAVALASGTALGTAVGSGGGSYDDWGCPPERISHSTFEPAEGGGYSTPEETLAAHVRYLAADGARSEYEYAEALASRTGPNRFELDTGTPYIENKIEARITLVQLADGTWTVDNELLCGRLVQPALASPDPTPGLDR
jgi:hypothetical protein